MKFKIEKQVKYKKGTDQPSGWHYALSVEVKHETGIYHEWLGNFSSGVAAKKFAEKYVVEVGVPVVFEIKEKK